MMEIMEHSSARKPEPQNPPPPTRVSSILPRALDFLAGDDIIDGLRRYAVGRGVTLCVLSASGSVSNVSLRRPPSTAAASAPPRVLSGFFDIASFSGIFRPAGTWSLSVTLATLDGAVVGGAVAEPLRAAGPVVVTMGLVTSVPHNITDWPRQP